MKLQKSTGEELIFRLARRERLLLEQLIILFPRMPKGYSKVTRQGQIPAPDEMQQLLHESLAEQRAHGRVFAQGIMARLEASGADSLLRLKRTEAESFLQVLNDIRVGSWIILGSPDAALDPSAVNEQNLPDFWAMEMAGYFQAHLLEGLSKAGLDG